MLALNLSGRDLLFLTQDMENPELQREYARARAKAELGFLCLSDSLSINFSRVEVPELHNEEIDLWVEVRECMDKILIAITENPEEKDKVNEILLRCIDLSQKLTTLRRDAVNNSQKEFYAGLANILILFDPNGLIYEGSEDAAMRNELLKSDIVNYTRIRR